MPCRVTEAEAQAYERDDNFKKFGVASLTSRITETVACELAKLIRDNGLQNKLSPLAKKWIKEHEEEDAKRSTKT